MKSKDEILSQFNRHHAEADRHQRAWRSDTRKLYQFRAGHQWSKDDSDLMTESKRPMVVFNLADKYVDAITGLQINNRQEPKYMPRELGDARVNEVYTSAVKWCRDLSEAEDEETHAFGDLIWCGMGWIEHSVDDMDDDTVVRQDRVDPLEMLWDPRARKKNLVDRRYQIRIKRASIEEYEELAGEKYSVEDSSGASSGVTSFLLDDDEPHVTLEPPDYPSDGDGVGTTQANNIYIADYQWLERVKKYKVTSSLGTKVFNDEEWAALKPQMDKAKEVDPSLSYTEEKINGTRYFRAKICKGKVLRADELPVGFTFEAMTGKSDRALNTWYGLGRGIEDPQKWVNKFFSSMIYQLAVNPKGGIIAEEDAFEDADEAKKTWANPSEITIVRPGALTNKKIDTKPSSSYPVGMDRMMEFTVAIVPQIVGVNAELLGLTDKVQSGVLESQRKQGAIAMVAWAFDALRRYHKRSGKLMAELVREFMADGRLIRIVGQMQQQYVPLVRDKLAPKYDVIIDEAPTSVNMKERTWALLVDILPMALKVGLPMPPSLLDYTPLPQDLIDEWKEMLKPKPEDSEEQQKQKQLAMREVMGRIAKDESAAKLNEARAADIAAKTPGEVQKLHAETLTEFANAGAAQAGPSIN